MSSATSKSLLMEDFPLLTSNVCSHPDAVDAMEDDNDD
jgi:hypothetical protein